ncbi:RNA polymerase sigma factor [Flavitalea flava]
MNDIVTNIKSGDIESFKLIYYQYHKKLYYYVLKHTQSEYLAEETVQMTFIKLWEKREGLTEDLELSPQLFRVAKSTMIDLLRKEGKRQDHTAALANESSDLRFEPEPLKKDELQHVYTIIEGMSPVRKTVFKLSRFNGLPHKEIAQQLSISPKTVENHIGRALRQLKDALLLILFCTLFF